MREFPPNFILIPENRAPENQAFWERLLDHAGMSVIDIDLAARAVRCSARLTRSLRMTPETLPRTPEQWMELCHPEDYAKNTELTRLLTGVPDVSVDSSEVFALSLRRRLYCGDGRYRRFRLDALCLRDEKGRAMRLIGTETNLSRRAAVALAFQEHRYRTRAARSELSAEKRNSARLYDRISRLEARHASVRFRLRLSGAITDTAEDILFYRESAEVDGGETRLFPGNEAFRRAAAEDPEFSTLARRVQDGETVFRRDRHGRIRTLEARVYPFSGWYGKMTGEIGAFSDKTEIGEAEAEMLRLRLLLGQGLRRPTSPRTDGTARSSPFEEDGEVLDSKEILGGWLNGALLALREASAMIESDLLPTRTAQLEDLLHTAGRTELEVGVVGITSSGKSTFINAMMGECLLPEETRATTNLVVRCFRGDERAVTVTLKNGITQRVTGTELTASWMEARASERLNPANEQEIALLEWTSPAAALPEGLVLLDTPGLDACDFPEHSELVLRRLLPALDIVLYITSIRNRLKAADLELLEAVLEQDQRILFILSQIDLERDDTEGGRVILSRRQKLADCVRELREDAAKRLPGVPVVVPVSSKLAGAHFYDRNSDAWAASNFGPLIRQMELFQADLGRYLTHARVRRALMLLSRTEADLTLTLGGVSAPRAEAEAASRLGKIRELREAWRWTAAEISAVRNEWRRRLDPEVHLQSMDAEMADAPTLKAAKERYARRSEEWAGLTAQMTARMDRARLSCIETLRRYGLTPGDRASGSPETGEGRLPDFYRYILHEARKIRVRGWFEGPTFWPEYRTYFRQDVNREKMLAETRDMVAERLLLLDGHLTWWENRMREDFCDMLHEEMTREETALADTRREATDAAVSRSALRCGLHGVRESVRGIQALISDLAVPDIDPESLFSETLFERYDNITPAFIEKDAPSDESGLNGPFAPLLAAAQERNLLARFLRSGTVEERAASGRPRVALLGLRQHDSLRFLSRLAHDASLADGVRGKVEGREWILCGATPPSLPQIHPLLPEEFSPELFPQGPDILIAPGDVSLAEARISEADWDALFAEWLPVVHLDIARIDSGLSDLARAPYVNALCRRARWVIAAGQGGLFDSRLADLLTDVPDRLTEFLRRRGVSAAAADLFVFENYDARYTDFILWGREALLSHADSGEAGFLERWAREGYDFAPPFTEYRLRRSLEEGRRALRARRNGGDAP